MVMENGWYSSNSIPGQKPDELFWIICMEFFAIYFVIFKWKLLAYTCVNHIGDEQGQPQHLKYQNWILKKKHD